MSPKPIFAASLLKPEVLFETISYRLRVAQIAAYRAFEGRLGEYGSAPRYFGLLVIIADYPGQAQSRLAEAISLQRSSLVAIIDRLEGEGLVERRNSRVDRRTNAVWLTAKGKEMVDALTGRAMQEEARISAGLSADERTTLIQLLGRVIDNIG